jgi:hypothetical protein
MASAILQKLKRLHARANQGWLTIWIQTTGGLLVAFGFLCVIRVQPDAFAFGVIVAFAQLFVPEAYLSSVGWSCIIGGLLLGIVTIPAQREQFVRFKKERAMLERKDWRK